MIDEEFTEKMCEFIIRRAIRLDIDFSVYHETNDAGELEQYPLDPSLLMKIETYSGQFLDLFDEHITAQAAGDIDKSNAILDQIISNEPLRLLAAYYLNNP